MGTAKKSKVSVTIAADLLARVDEYAARSGIGNRSSVVELWLRRAARMEAAKQLERDTITYYESLTATEVEEDSDWAGASSEAFATLEID